MSHLAPGDLAMLIAKSHIQYFCETCGTDVRKYIGEVGEVVTGLVIGNHGQCGTNAVPCYTVRFADGFQETFRPELLRKIEPPPVDEVVEDHEELTV